MSQVSAEQIKQLRETTGAGMMDCRKALLENEGNVEQAVDWLRKKGLAAAAKKSGRTAAEGLVAVAVDGTKGCIIELNSETDFVARNEIFQTLVRNVASTALSNSTGDLETLKQTAYPETGRNVAEEVTHTVGVIGENMNLRRADLLEVSKGVVARYIHNMIAPDMGKIGILVGLESDGDAEKLEQFGRQIAMHIAAAKPDALSTDDVDQDNVARERDVYREQAEASGKPANVIEKMIEGRVRKYYEEIVLLEQQYVVDGKSKVREVVEAFAKELGSPVRITGFKRFQLGDGIEKQQTDFAAEVAAAAGTNAA